MNHTGTMTRQDFLSSLQSEYKVSLRGLAKLCGTSHSTLLRQEEEGFKADTILNMARSLNHPFLALAVQADVISEVEAQAIAESVVTADITAFSDEALAREMLRRAKKRKSSMLNRSIDQPLPPDVPNLSARRPTIGEQKEEGFKAANEWTEDVPED